MKKLFIMLLVSTNAMALDFDTEWAKFEKDFVKLRGEKVTIAKVEPIVADYSLLSENTTVNKLERVDPKSPKRLGRNLENPYMREKMSKLYDKPDTVVYSLTLE